MGNALDYLVLGLYFAVMLGAGYWGLRRAGSTEDYLVAGRRLGPALYVGTLSAVVLGGGFDHRQRLFGVRVRRLGDVARVHDRARDHRARHPALHAPQPARRLHGLGDARHPLRGLLAPYLRDHRGDLRAHDRGDLHHSRRLCLRRRPRAPADFGHPHSGRRGSCLLGSGRHVVHHPHGLPAVLRDDRWHLPDPAALEHRAGRRVLGDGRGAAGFVLRPLRHRRADNLYVLFAVLFRAHDRAGHLAAGLYGEKPRGRPVGRPGRGPLLPAVRPRGGPDRDGGAP